MGIEEGGRNGKRNRRGEKENGRDRERKKNERGVNRGAWKEGGGKK